MDLDAALREAMAERHFQVRLNWERNRFLLGLCVFLLAVGVWDESPLPFLTGVPLSVASCWVTYRQHAYYRAARDRVRRLEAACKVPAQFRVDTTSVGRGMSVMVAQVVMLGSVGLGCVLGAVVTLRAGL